MADISPGESLDTLCFHEFQSAYKNSASNDNIRLWNASDAGEPDAIGRTRSGVQFKIIPGHHGGYISQMGKCIFSRV